MKYLYGASGHAKVIIEILEALKEAIGGIIDDNPDIQSLLGYPVQVSLPEAFELEKDRVLVSIGSNLTRKKIAEVNHFKYFNAIHPSVNLSKHAEIGLGTVVMAGVSINSETHIGNHVILNTNCSIDHDCIIKDYVHVSPNAALAGAVLVGEGTHIGIGACVIQGIEIGKWCTIGAGSVIIKNVPDGSTVVGNPGRIIN